MAQVEITLRHYSNVTVPVAGTIWDKEQPVSELSAWWESDKEGVIAHVEPDADGLVYGDLALREGIHEVSLVALDPKGDTGSDTVLVIVSGPNSPPSMFPRSTRTPRRICPRWRGRNVGHSCRY